MPLPVGETDHVESPLSQPKIGLVRSRHCGRRVKDDRGRRQRYELDAACGQLSLPFVYRTAVALPRKIQHGDLISGFGERRCRRKANRADTAVAMRSSELAGRDANAQAAERPDRRVVHGKAWKGRLHDRRLIVLTPRAIGSHPASGSEMDFLTREAGPAYDMQLHAATPR